MLFPARILKPDALAMLTRVCKTICDQQDIPLRSPEAQTMASYLLKLYMNGLTGEDELLEAERNRRFFRQATEFRSLYQSEMTPT